MNVDYAKLAMQFGELLGTAQGGTLKVAHMTKQGMEFVFENATTQTQVRIVPKVYPAGKVLVDALNTFTLLVEVKQFGLEEGQVPENAPVVGGGAMELPYSTWFFEGDYLG